MYNKPSFNSFSFGCRVNEAEKREIDKEMIMAGFNKTDKAPDVCIINTCAVTSKAEREARQLILRLKRNNPRLKLVVTGCSATYWLKNNLAQNIPIDLIISNLNKKFLVRLLLKRLYKENKGNTSNIFITRSLKDKFLDSGRLLLKIQDGCHRFCSYCIVPYLRGAPVSRPIKDILSAVLSYRPYIQETILTAINTEAYGKDNGESIVELVQTLLTKTDIPRISFGSIHPWSITPEFLHLLKNNNVQKRFVRFFHIPVQSASDKVLALMKRGYSKKELLERLNDLKSTYPDALFATDVIVGFLDESDGDFQETYDFLKKSPVIKFHVFRYSPRRNTAAYYLEKRLNEPTAEQKEKRSRALRELSIIKYQRFLGSFIGRSGEVLFIGHPEKGFQTGLLFNQIPVIVPVKQNLSGTIRHVTIRTLKNGALRGKIS